MAKKIKHKEKLVVPVDSECTLPSSKAHVFISNSDVYDVMLNQTNIGNNNNKFYLIQLLESNYKPNTFWVWQRWGRVGFKGQNNLVAFEKNVEDAIDSFKKKFFDKTKNEWEFRKKFKKVSGKYDLVKIDYSIKENLDIQPLPKKIKIIESTLSQELQDLITMISSLKEMEDAVSQMKYDSSKAPLGRLTKEQIKAGYMTLKLIDDLIDKKEKGQLLTEACSEFYTRVPHYFGMKRPTVINTKEAIKEKMELLEALGDIEIALRLIKESENEISDHPIDAKYKSLKCQLDLVSKDSEEYKMINEYLQTTHAPTHCKYKLEISNIFSVKREKEEKNFIDYGNKMLLWHGSRLTNFMGILSQGLRIAPPEAPVTGYMFGKGIYFADMSSKSANYCNTTKSKNNGLMLLSEVSLGSVNKLIQANSQADKLPKGMHSVMGAGSVIPDTKSHTKWNGDICVPIGLPTETGDAKKQSYSLNYNEYIVYNPGQVKMRFLVQLQFKYL